MGLPPTIRQFVLCRRRKGLLYIVDCKECKKKLMYLVKQLKVLHRRPAIQLTIKAVALAPPPQKVGYPWPKQIVIATKAVVSVQQCKLKYNAHGMDSIQFTSVNEDKILLYLLI